MTFDVAPAAYGRFMGRYSEPLAIQFADWAGVEVGQHALDVGCGPGALTAELVRRLGPDAVVAIDPSPPFVAAVRERCPDAEVHQGTAEELPFDDDRFDVALAQLVVHFMANPVTGLASMRRVTRPGGVVAACVWDHARHTGPLSTFWRAVRDLDPDAPGEANMPGVREGQLITLAEQAGVVDLEPSHLSVDVAFSTFDEWWEPFTLGVGPAGAYLTGLVPDRVAALRNRCAELIPTAPFEVHATVWCVRGRA